MMDTSSYIALESNDGEASSCQREVLFRKLPVFVTSTVVAETHRRLLFDFGRDVAMRFLTDVYSGSTTVVRPTFDDEAHAIELIRKYADLTLSFCDALTIAVMFRLGILHAFSYDRKDFQAVGLITVPPLYVL